MTRFGADQMWILSCSNFDERGLYVYNLNHLHAVFVQDFTWIEVVWFVGVGAPIADSLMLWCENWESLGWMTRLMSIFCLSILCLFPLSVCTVPCLCVSSKSVKLDLELVKRNIQPDTLGDHTWKWRWKCGPKWPNPNATIVASPSQLDLALPTQTHQRRRCENSICLPSQRNSQGSVHLEYDIVPPNCPHDHLIIQQPLKWAVKRIHFVWTQSTSFIARIRWNWLEWMTDSCRLGQSLFDWARSCDW